jgi:hypothetical protein
MLWRLDQFVDLRLACELVLSKPTSGCSGRAVVWCYACRGFFCGRHAARARHGCLDTFHPDPGIITQDPVGRLERFPFVLAICAIGVLECVLMLGFLLSGRLPGL